MKVVSIDSEWKHYSTKVVSELVFLFLYGKCFKLNTGATAVYAMSCLYTLRGVIVNASVQLCGERIKGHGVLWGSPPVAIRRALHENPKPKPETSDAKENHRRPCRITTAENKYGGLCVRLAVALLLGYWPSRCWFCMVIWHCT